MYLENWRLINCLPIISGTVSQIHSPCSVFPIVLIYIPKGRLLHIQKIRQAATLAVVLVASQQKHVDEGLMMDVQQWRSPGL